MSGCKINQNMEFGDIIYFILLVFFLILGFFNDSRKKKQQQQKQAEAQRQQEVESRPFFEEEEEVIPPYPQGRMRKVLPPPVPAAYSAKERYNNFQSSLDLVSIHQEPSTLSSYTFDYDVNSFYEADPDSPDASDNTREEKSKKSLHPLLQALRGQTGQEELKKGLIYGEIMQRKY